MGISYLGKCLLIEEKGENILVIGDLHLGYEESLNRGGVFISRKMFEEMIGELERIFSKSGKIDKIVLLGDVKHNFSGVLRQEWDEVSGLLEYLEGKLKDGGEIIIIRGNHDNYLKNIVNFDNRTEHLSEIIRNKVPECTRESGDSRCPVIGNSEEVKRIAHIAFKKGVKVCDYFVLGEFCFLHGDRDFSEILGEGVKYWIIGHGHPAVKLGDGVKVESYKCFLVGGFEGREIVIVPSFFEYFAGSDPRENDLGLAWKFDLEKFKVLIVDDKGLEVRDFGILRDLR